MTEHILNNNNEYLSFLKSNPGAVTYFSTNECNVCKVLRPKLIEFLKKNYPNMAFAYVNINDSKDVAANNQVFTVPTILFYFDGKELIRKSRNVSFASLDDELGRIYSMMFE